MFKTILGLLIAVTGSTAMASSWSDQQTIYCETDNIYAVTINHYIGLTGHHYWNLAEVIRDGKDVVTESTRYNPLASTCATSVTTITEKSGNVRLGCELYGSGETVTSTERSSYYVRGSLTFSLNEDGDPRRVSEHGLQLMTTRRLDDRRQMIPMKMSCRLVK